jgi:formate--tetrahydrofolate ligase
MKDVKSDIEIARAAEMKPIGEIAARLEIPEEALYAFGPHKAKVSFDYLESLRTVLSGRDRRCRSTLRRMPRGIDRTILAMV